MKCSYPRCESESEYKARDDLSLCEEHYNLYKFIDYLLFTSTIEINLKEMRFPKKEVEG